MIDTVTSDRPRPGSGAMFDRIAGRYDLLNRLISLGLDHGWRRRAVASLPQHPGARILDLATGTGDVALEVLRQNPEASVVGLDPSPRMLAVGEEKVASAGVAGRISLQLGTAEELPFDDDTFDGVTIAFGIRNVPDRGAALREMARVTRAGGRVAILELSEPRGGLLSPFARFHVRHVVPRLGAWLSGESEYRYLRRSIEEFPPPEAFAAKMADAGLEVVELRRMTLGTCCLYVARPNGGEVAR